MKKDVFDAVLASTPTNKAAMRVTSEASRDDHYEEAPLPSHVLHWKAPPQMRAFTNPFGTDVDLTGKVVGRFTVIGILDTQNGDQKWVCRCTCGDYETRSGRALRVALAGLGGDNINENMNYRCYYCGRQVINQRRLAAHGSLPVEHFTKPAKPKTSWMKKTPLEVIAWWLKDDRNKAQSIITALNRAGYRIVKDKAEHRK